MTPFVAISVAMLPAAVFGLAVGWGQIGLGAWLGATLAGAAVLRHCKTGTHLWLELTMLVTLAAIALCVATGVELGARTAAGLGFAGLAVGTGLSVLTGRPWTADYARAQFQGATNDPLFVRINSLLSAMWSVLFAWLAFANFEGMGPAALWLPTVIGSVTSVLLPNWWVQRNLQQRIDAQEPYKWQPPDFAARRASVDFDVIVVGAGVGGLTAGALLAQSGLRVLVCEQHSVPGGFAHTWTWTGQHGDSKPVFRFDSGVHDVSGVWDGAAVHGILTQLGLANGIEWKHMQHRYLTNGLVFDVPPSWSAYVDALAETMPASAVGIRSAMADIHTIFESMYSLAKQRGGVPGAPTTVEGLLSYAHQNPLAMQWMSKPFLELLRSHIASQAARDAVAGLTAYITDDPTSLTVAEMVPLFGYYIHGGWYPLGGSGVIAQALCDGIIMDGGNVRLKTPVARVLTENGTTTGVRLTNGQTLRSSAVVVNSDFLTAVDHLLDTTQWPPALRRAVNSMAPACSAFGVHLGVRGGFAGVPPVIHLRQGKQRLEIVIPSNADSSAAPEGYSTVELLRLMSHDEALEWFDDAELTNNLNQRHSPAYAEKKRRMGDQLVQLAEQALPGLGSRIVCRTEASPLTFRRYNWSQGGAIYGKSGAVVPTKSPSKGLVFAGAAVNGPGIEAVMIAGANAAQALVPGILMQNFAAAASSVK